MKTCSFKETEAYSVCGRLPLDCKQILTVGFRRQYGQGFRQSLLGE